MIIELVVVGLAATLPPITCWMRKIRVRDVGSGLCEKLAIEPAVSADLARDAFSQIPVCPVALTVGHTHANAAGLRTSATQFAQNLAQFCGSELYVVGMSRSDQRRGLRGSRRWHWTKDVNTSNRDDKPKDFDIRYICDVDYYLDMHHLLTHDVKPVLLYTVVPEEASSNGGDDTTFYFESDGSLTTLVSGGGRYNHLLWDYGSDSLLVVKLRFGLPVRVVAYAIERKQVGKHRQVVLLAPIRIFDGLAGFLAYWLLDTQELKRFNPIIGCGGNNFVRINVVNAAGVPMVSTARPGVPFCATVTAADDAAVATVARLGATKLMLPTAASWVNDRAAAAILTDYYRNCAAPARAYVYPVELGVRAYQYQPAVFDQDAKPKLQAFMSPLIHGAFAPVANKAGEERCVEGRINSLKRKEPRQNNFRDRCMDEFANLVCGGALLEPVCYEVVEAKQTSAAQVLSLSKAVVTGNFVKRVLKCFVKAEAYPDVKDPRNISTYNDADKLDMATFALSLSEHLKQYPWYGPGKTPFEIAERVVEICRTAKFVNISDYHRMDGTISYTLRKVDRAVCMKAFANHGAHLNELLKRNVDNVGYLPNGTQFDQGSSHGSGCSATSVFQTLRAAFNAYLAFRRTRKSNGNPYTPAQAFQALGIHLGDDGLDADLPVESHQWASTTTGLILEAAVVQRGERGVNFLARYYSQDVWEGLPDSMCDVKRQLSKFHTTVRLPSNITPEQKFVEKAMSYIATDGNTPVIGALCKQLLLLSSYRPKSLLGVGNWWARFEDSVQYPNENVGGWMDTEFEHALPGFDRTLFGDWLATAQTPQDMLEPPLCLEIKPPTAAVVAVVVDEEILDPCPSDAETEASTRPPSSRSASPNPRRVRSRKTRRKRREYKPSEQVA